MFFQQQTIIISCFNYFTLIKILWYNNAWVIHKRGGQNYFNKIDDLILPHPLRVLKKPNEIY